MDLGDAATERRLLVHLRGRVGEEEHLAVAGAGDERQLLALVHDLESRVAHTVLTAHRLEVLLPALAVGWVGKHEVELLRRERVVRERGPFRAADDVVGALAFALQQHVGLADGVGFGVDLLAIEQAPDLLAALFANGGERLLGDGEHAAGAAGTVIEQVGAGPDLGLDRQEHEVRHQRHRVARRPVLTRFLLVLLVEPADQLLEDRAHRVVVDASRREVDVGVEELVDQRTDCIGLRQRLELVAELEVVEDILDVEREAVEVVLEVGKQLLLAATGLEVAQRELRGVVESLPRGVALLGDARLVEHFFGLKHLPLGRFEHRIHAPDDAHRQDDVRVLASLEEVAQNVVGDAPDERDDLVVGGLIHVHATPNPHVLRAANLSRSARSPALFFVELGALTIAVSTIVPLSILMPLRRKYSFTVTSSGHGKVSGNHAAFFPMSRRSGQCSPVFNNGSDKWAKVSGSDGVRRSGGN